MITQTATFQDDRHLGKVGRGKIAFGWYGGKFSHLSWLLPLLPKCHHYIEPFGGSGQNVSGLTTRWYPDGNLPTP